MSPCRSAAHKLKAQPRFSTGLSNVIPELVYVVFCPGMETRNLYMQFIVEAYEMPIPTPV
jgi:hypothetical protein